MTSIHGSYARAFLLLVLIAFASVSSGCDSISSMLISNAQEVELGAAVDEQIHDENKIVLTTDPTSIWANQLVDSMKAAANEHRQSSEFEDYKVKVIYDNDLVNAFAAPGGYIYLVSGLVLAADNCGQVAGVVAHELAHVTERHSIKRVAKHSAALGLTDLIFEQGLTKSVIDGVYTFLLQTTFSRRDETQADEVGATIMHDSGYNPYALAGMFQKFADLSDGREPPRFLSSHPLSKDRVQAIQKQIAETWPDENIQQSNDPVYSTDCLSTDLNFEEVQELFRSGNVAVDPNTGLLPPTQP